MKSLFNNRLTLMIGGSGAAQAVTFGVMPIVSRLYGPAEYAQYSLFFSVFSLFAAIGTLNFEIAIISRIEVDEDRKLFQLCLALSFVSSTVLSLVYYVIARALFSDQLEFIELTSFVMAIMLVASLTISAWRNFALVRSNYMVISGNRIVQSIFKSLSLVLLGFAGSGYVGLLVSELIGFISGLRPILICLRDEFREKYSLSTIIHTFEKYKEFPLLVLPSTVLGIGGSALTIPLMVWAFGLTESGLFAFAQRIMSIPSSVIGTSLADLFQQSASKDIKGALESMKKYAVFSIPLLVFTSVATFFILPMLFGSIFGDEWSGAGRIASLIVLWIGSQFITGILGRIVYVIGWQSRKLIQDATILCIIVITIIVCKLFNISMEIAITAISVFTSLTALFYVRDLINYTEMEVIK